VGKRRQLVCICVNKHLNVVGGRAFLGDQSVHGFRVVVKIGEIQKSHGALIALHPLELILRPLDVLEGP
jgi:hypothetical protein